MMISAPILRQPPPNRHHSCSLIYVGRGLLPCWSAFGRELVVLRDQPKRRLLKMTPQIPTMTMIYRRNRKSVISSFISYLIHAYRVFNHLMRLYDFLSVSPLRMCVYFTFLHLVSYLITINQQCPIWLTHYSL